MKFLDLLKKNLIYVILTILGSLILYVLYQNHQTNLLLERVLIERTDDQAMLFEREENFREEFMNSLPVLLSGQVEPPKQEIVETKELFEFLVADFQDLKTKLQLQGFIPQAYQEEVINASERNAVPVSVLYGIGTQESNWRPNAINQNVNGSEDRGLMQINSNYQEYYVQKFWDHPEEFNPWNPSHSIELASKILRFNYEHLGSWRKAIIAYNLGITRTENRGLTDSQYFRDILDHLVHVSMQ